MYTAIVVMLIVIFGAGLMGKMLKEMHPGSVFDLFSKKNTENTPNAD